MKNHHKHLTDNWKEILIHYFDNGDYEFKNKLFNLHKKKGLSASKHFEDFMVEQKERQKKKRIERQRKKKEKQSMNQKSNNDKSETTVTEQGEIY